MNGRIREWLRRVLARVYTRRIVQQQRDEIVVLARPTDVLMGCCDCGLMHRYDFFLNKRGQLCIRGRRDFIATAAIRQSRTFTHVERYDRATVAHARESEQEYRRTLWAAAARLWPEPLRVAQIDRDAWSPREVMETRTDAQTNELLIFAKPIGAAYRREA